MQDWVRAYDGSRPPEEFYCQTRDIVQARVESLRSSLVQNDWSETLTSLIVAVIGELTSNAFDHNIGQWPDVPGCWFESSNNREQVNVTIADRGQGVRSSLERIRPGIDDVQALQIAFIEHVTGRAPEKRGNGLKFVMNVLRELEVARLEYFSGSMKPPGSARLLYSTQTDTQKDVTSLIDRPAGIVIRGVYATLQIQKSV